MILDVAVAARLPGEQRPLELGEEHLVGLPQHVAEHVHAPAVRHAEDHLLDAERAALVHERRQDRDERVAAFEGEALRGGITNLQELLQALGQDQILKDVDAVLA